MECKDDVITVKPTINGAHARAWRVDPHHVAPHSLVTSWLVEVPWAHPVWHSYRISLIHLRPVPGLDDAVIYRSGATHEIAVYALDPDMPRQAVFDSHVWDVLTPPNFVDQFIAQSDAAADARIADVVRLICDGWLSPDTDFRGAWIKLFGEV